ISYSLKDVSAFNLAAPALAEEIPVQQTLWRLWIPEDYCLLWHDRIFSHVGSGSSGYVLQKLRANQPGEVTFKLPGQGKDFNFIRQGAPGRLCVMVAGKEVISVVVWTLVIAAGVLMLKLSGFHRVLVILAAALAAGVIHLFAPLLVNRILRVGVFAAILILLLWLARWAYSRWPQLRQQWAAGKQRTAQEKREARARKQQKTSVTEQGSEIPDKKKKQSKKDQG
ncbi:MAG: hypothetical protein ACYTEK_19180, partial [Planctomycetota bacterium]